MSLIQYLLQSLRSLSLAEWVLIKITILLFGMFIGSFLHEIIHSNTIVFALLLLFSYLLTVYVVLLRK